MPTRRESFHALAGVFGGAALAAAQTAAAQTVSKAPASRLAMPGLWRGRVVAVSNPSSIVSGAYQADAVRAMMRRGMAELCGGDWADAWRGLFEPGDVVGIKVTPVGQPHVISDATVVREIVAGLREAGVRARDIVVFDRYGREFAKAGFASWLPEGVRTAHAVERNDPVQQAIEGYDPDHYIDMALTLPGQSVDSVTARRSYAARFITTDVNKLVNLPALKDHQSAGVTLALKNLSHGLVNNVSRSHSTRSLNACGMFIPTVVAMPVIRNKTVLNILDGVKGLYHGGPSARPQFVWEHKTLYFSTDPVAIDRIGWEEIDRRRAAAGLKPVAADAPDNFSTFVRRQPEHVEIAGALGLGEFDRAKIDLRKIS